MVENVTQIKSGTKINVGVSAKIQGNIMCVKKFLNIGNSATYSCRNDKYLGSIIDDSVITCDEIVDTTKTVSTKIFQQILKKAR